MAANTILTSVLTGGSNNHTTTAEEANVVATDFVTPGVVGTIVLNSGSGGSGSFCVNADSSPDMGITIKSGQAYVTATPSSQNSQVLRARASSDYTTYTINANASGSTKYDWIYLKIDATNANTPSADGSNVASIFTSRSSSNTADNGTPPTYGLLLAVVTVANGASSITNSNIQDRRTQAVITASGSTLTSGWNIGTLPIVSSVAANGSRSYNITFASTVAGYLTPGMKLRLARTSAAPTQCTSLNGTTQYYSKSSPAGMTFTDGFTVIGWVKLTGYQVSILAARDSATPDGWACYFNASGQLIIGGQRVADDFGVSYQSVPLNRWVHVAATFNSATTTVTMYLDGTSVPVAYTNNANTGIVQGTGNFNIGRNAGGNFFKGSIAQVAVFSSVLSAATIQSYMSQGLVGTETSLVSAYSFNNSLNDLNANANNLTANGSAVATNADSPFGGQADGTISSTLEYAEVVSVSTTVATVRTTDVNAIPTTGGVTAVDMSSWANPYNCPAFSKAWGLVLFCTGPTTTATATGTQLPGATITMTAPTGGKKFVVKAYSPSVTGSTTAVIDVYNGSSQVSRGQVPNVTNGQTLNIVTQPLTISGSQTFTLNAWSTAAGTTTMAANPGNPAWFSVEEA